MDNNEMLLLKLGEVVLKGQNRRSFEDRLVTSWWPTWPAA